MKKTIKKIRKISITILCVITMLDCTVYAGEGTVFHIKNQKGKSGETITVPIEIHSREDVGGFELTVYYDNNILKFESLSKGDLIISDDNDGLFDYNHKVDSASIKIVYVVADTVKADGVIANIKFKLKKDCEEELPVGMKIDQVVDNSDQSKVINGEVSGVNADFQKQIESYNGTVSEYGESSSDKDKVKTKESSANNTQEKKQKEISGNKDGNLKKEIEDAGKISKKINIKFENKKKKEPTKNNTLIVGATGMILIAGIVAILIQKKKKNNEEETR